MSLNRASWYCIVATTAACSMIYELNLAQILSVILGESTQRYTATIGFYLFAMGMGALYQAQKPPTDPITFFARVEILLAAIGLLAAPAILTIDGLLGIADAPYATRLVIGHAAMLAIGFLSGMELPLLLQIGKQDTIASSRMVAADFLGSSIGAVVFPLLLIPQLGVIATGTATSLVNATVVLLLARRASDLRWTAAGAIVLVGSAVFTLSQGAEYEFALVDHIYRRFWL